MYILYNFPSQSNKGDFEQIGRQLFSCTLPAQFFMTSSSNIEILELATLYSC
jgi:hypothetical protein